MGTGRSTVHTFVHSMRVPAKVATAMVATESVRYVDKLQAFSPVKSSSSGRKTAGLICSMYQRRDSEKPYEW